MQAAKSILQSSQGVAAGGFLSWAAAREMRVAARRRTENFILVSGEIGELRILVELVYVGVEIVVEVMGCEEKE